jgi:hypothetical protein
MLIDITAMMQEIRHSCGFNVRKSRRGSACSTEQREGVGQGKKVGEDARAFEIWYAHGLGVVVSLCSLQRHIWTLCCFTTPSCRLAVPMKIGSVVLIARVMPKERLCDALTFDKEDLFDC